jgi:hypothetical protein
MKKKIILIIAIVATFTLFVCVLAGCSDSNTVISKDGHDAIIDAGLNSYIAVDEGKSYLYSLEKSKKIFDDGYDSLSFISEYNSNYLIAYNKGDVGMNVLNAADGSTLIASTTDMKIYVAEIVADIITSDTAVPDYTEKAIRVYFTNDENNECSALFDLNGSAIFYDKDGTIDVFGNPYVEDTSDFELQYIVAYTYDTIDSVDSQIVGLKIFKSDFVEIYSKSYSEAVDFAGLSKHVELIEVKYNNLFYNDEGNILTDETENLVDVITPSTAYTGYNSIVAKNYDDVASIITSSNIDDTTTYTLIKSDVGITKTFDSLAIFYNGYVKVSVDSSYDIFDTNGNSLISGVSVESSGALVKETDEIKSFYGLSGKSLFDVNKSDFDSCSLSRTIIDDAMYEVYTISDGSNEKEYKFFINDELVKDYGNEYTFLTSTSGVYEFNILDSESTPVSYFMYNFYNNVEKTIDYNEEGSTNIEVSGSINDIKYFVEKDSNTISFYNEIVQDITPYEGTDIPGYSVSNNYYNINYYNRNNEISFNYIEIEYNTLSKTADEGSDPITYTYESTGETMYAYYLVVNNDIVESLVLLYNGYNPLFIDLNSEDKLFYVSTADAFYCANNYSANMYSSKLEDKTTIYNIVCDNDLISSISQLTEVAISNVYYCNDKYIFANDYSNDLGLSKIYSIDGTLILDSKYSVWEIDGDLAYLGYSGKGIIYNLEKGKVLEDDFYYGGLISDNYYYILNIEEDGYIMEIKDIDGKTIVDEVRSIYNISSYYDSDENATTTYFVIYTGDDEQKVLSIKVDGNESLYISLS